MRRAAIIGLGLIGGSIGIALGKKGWSVAYLDPAVAIDEAVRHGAAEERLSSPGGITADVVVLAAPVDVSIEMLRSLETSGIVTSVCSVMEPLRLAAPGHLRFVAGHPFAGSERRTLAAARGDLFEGKRWFLDEAVSRPEVEELIGDCGAELRRVDPRRHDRAVALTSHLPQLLSTALGALVDGQHVDEFAGSGLQTFLRLAGSDSSVWEPIFAANRDAILAALKELEAIAEALLEGGRSDAFDSAQRLHERLTRL